MESIVNVVAALLLVWSLRMAAQPADRDHPYGHGKAEFLSAAVEGALIIVAALLILGSLPLLAGLAVVLPILGHATWHLYRKVVEPLPQTARLSVQRPQGAQP